jgi:hypothetical protein
MFARKLGWGSFGLSCLLVLCLGLFAFGASARAQDLNATLSGTVMDPSGAAVADAELTLTNRATGFELKATSNERGEYTFRNLTPSTYDLKIMKTGFGSYIQKDILITINAAAHADATLKVGTASETVTVEGGNTLINYDNATIQEGIEPETLKSLPLVVEGKLRSAASIVLLLPGVTTGNSAQPFSARINGGQETGDEALLDGASMQQGFMSQSGMISIHQDFTQSPDVVQEVKVIASDYDAEYGGTTSAVVAVVTKSGGSEYHGAAYEYARNTSLNAKPWNSAKRPVDIENDFGANIGGPIKIPFLYHGTSKHKSFFYFNWEAYRLAGGSSVPTISIPSALERAGNFTDWIDTSKPSCNVTPAPPGCQIPVYAPSTFAPGSVPTQTTGPQSTACKNALPAGFGPGQQFPGNIIPTACISPIAAAYLAFMPTPTNLLATNNYTLSRPVPDTLTANSKYFMFRIDHNYGDSDHFYFTYWRQYTSPNLATTLPHQIANDRFTPLQNSPIMRFNWEHIFSTKMTNHVTLGYLNRNEGDSTLNLDQIGKLPGIAGVAGKNTLPSFNFSDGFQTISSVAANKTTRPTWVLNDVASRVIGHHTVTFGAEWRNVGGNINFLENQAGTFSFDRKTTSLPNITSGSPIAGYLLGAVSTGTVDFRSIPSWYPRQKVYALHANDSWKMTPKLTVNYGLRWDYFQPSYEKQNHFSFIDPVGANPNAGGRPGRLAFAGNGYGSASFGRIFPEEAWKKGFAPRLGVAYAYNPKTVVRAGYGIFFARAFYPGWGGGMALGGFNLKDQLGLLGPAGIDPPFYLDTGFPSPNAPPPLGIGCTLGTTCINSGFDNGRFPIAANGNGSAYRPVDGNHRPYSSQWNLTIERQLPQEVLLSVAYVGNKGTRLTSSLQPINVLNPFDPAVKALEANTTPIDPSCKSGNPTAGVNCGYVPELNAVFTSDNQTLFGVKSPYSGWVGQLNNAGACSPTVAQALLPFPQFCGALPGLNENRGNSIYHSFQVKIEKRYSKGLYMLVSYTNSKLISDAADAVQQAGAGQAGGNWNASQGVISPFEKRRARAISGDDVPQVLSATFVYDLPFGKGKRYANQGGAVNYLVGGWQFSPFIHYSRGTPMWFRSSSCQVVPQFRQNCLVGLVPGVNPFLQDPNGFNPGKGPLLNSAAFESVGAFQPAGGCPTCTGVFGYTGSGPRITNLRGPNYKNLDFSLNKNTRFGERVNFQLRFAFFNAFNSHYFINNGVNNEGSSFAFIDDIAAGGANGFGSWDKSNVSPPRTIQIGARLEF